MSNDELFDGCLLMNNLTMCDNELFDLICEKLCH